MAVAYVQESATPPDRETWYELHDLMAS